ncbi:RING-box protein 2 isoform X4 [Rhineura floridana]|uniref:RING-box protein 2 isoform X4 n=1 Tax=Rhineura floridana TaxID=261503 RepID=UPI002AC85BC9|nr:RING-box protein 2 isoform X4 [Rhineura floridana]
MADVEDGDESAVATSHAGFSGSKAGGVDKMFSLKKWNAVAMWSWDVECDTCAICRVQVMDACLRCQAENKQEDCVGIIAFGLALRRKCLKCSIGGLGRV